MLLLPPLRRHRPLLWRCANRQSWYRRLAADEQLLLARPHQVRPGPKEGQCTLHLRLVSLPRPALHAHLRRLARLASPSLLVHPDAGRVAALAETGAEARTALQGPETTQRDEARAEVADAELLELRAPLHARRATIAALTI